jgi:membrane protease YdiL (CAAX protease family)
LIAAALSVAVVGAAISVGLRPALAGTPAMLAAIGIPYALTAAIALFGMHRRGQIWALLRPRSGDLTYGAVAAALLFFAAWLGRMVLAPHGTGREAWLMRIYLQIGDPDALQRHFAIVAGAVVFLAFCEEVTWRGQIYGALKLRLGARRAWPLAAVLYALAHVPTVVLLRDSFAGPNPLVVFAALGCGLVWGVLVATTDRLPVAIFSHALFLWVAAYQFPLWRFG